MDAALAFGTAAPATVARRRVRFGGLSAGDTADRAITFIAERMARQAAFAECVVDIFGAPMGQRVEADAAIDGLDGLQPATFAAVIALATGDPGVETVKRALERQDFTQIATQIRVALPQRAARVVTGEVEGNWFDGAHVAQAQAAYQYAAVGEGVVK